MTRRFRLTATAAMLAALGFAPAGCLVPVSPDASPSPGALPPGAVLPNGMPATGQLPGALGALRNVTPQAQLGLGESKPLSSMFLNDKGQVPVDGVVWTSSSDAVVQVNPTTGIARGVGKGSAVITVSLQNDPSVKAQVTINVSDPNGVSTIELTPANDTLAVGDKLSLRVQVKLGTGEVKSNVFWSSSDPSIAKVDTEGNVTAVGVGTAQILAAYADDPVYKGQAFVRVVGTRAEVGTATAAPTGPVATAATSDDPGLVATRKPGTWVEQTSGTTEQLTYIKFFDAKNGVAGGNGVLLTTTDAGTTWKKAAAAGTPIEYAFNSPSDGWLVYGDGIKQANGGSVSALVDAQAAFGAAISDVLRTSKSDAYVLTAIGALYETDDGGKTWTEIPTTGGQPKPTKTATPTPAPTATPTPEPTATPTAEPTEAAGYRTLAYNFQSGWEYGGLSMAGDALRYNATFYTTCKAGQFGNYTTCYTRSQLTRQGSGWKEDTLTEAAAGNVTFASAKEGWRLGNGAQRTVDGGTTWLPVDFGNEVRLQPTQFSVADAKVVAFVGRESNYMGGQVGSALAVTENGGRTWYRIGLENIDATAIAIVDPANIWVAGSEGKIKRYVIL